MNVGVDGGASNRGSDTRTPFKGAPFVGSHLGLSDAGLEFDERRIARLKTSTELKAQSLS
jgi:hypothetical protein